MPSAQIETPLLSQVNWWGGVELVPGWEQGPWASGLKGGDWSQARPRVVDMFCPCVCAMLADGHTGVWTHRCTPACVHTHLGKWHLAKDPWPSMVDPQLCTY